MEGGENASKEREELMGVARHGGTNKAASSTPTNLLQAKLETTCSG